MNRMLPLMAMTAISMPTLAAESGTFYVAVGGGAYQIESQGFDDTAPSATLLGGYNLSERFAIEAAYSRLFDAKHNVDDVGIKISGNVWDLSTKMSIPVGNRFSPYGRIGWSYLDVKAVAMSDGVAIRANDYDDRFTWAIGAGYKLKPRMSLSGEYGQIEVNRGNFERMTLNLNYQFGSH